MSVRINPIDSIAEASMAQARRNAVQNKDMHDVDLDNAQFNFVDRQHVDPKVGIHRPLTDRIHKAVKVKAKGWDMIGKKLHILKGNHVPKTKEQEKEQKVKIMIGVVVGFFIVCLIICVVWFYYYPGHYIINNPSDPRLDGFYYFTTTISTVGYGDILPCTARAKAFTCFMQLLATIVSLGIVFKLTDDKLKYLLEKSKQKITNVSRSSILSPKSSINEKRPNTIDSSNPLYVAKLAASSDGQMSIAAAAEQARKEREMNGQSPFESESEEGLWANNTVDL